MRAPFFVAVALAACGEPEPAGERASFVVPFHAAQRVGCADPSNLAEMTATLYIGGDFEPCALTVNDDLSVSGACGGITIGIPRPLMIVYDLDGVELAYNIGSVDLSKEAVPEDGVVRVSLDGVSSRIIYLESEVDQIDPNGGDAVTWALCEVLRPSTDCPGPVVMSLEDDADDCSNLAEACNGTLGTGDTTACN
jgi:hypothetical protein